MAEKRHRRPLAWCSCTVATLVLADDRCTCYGLVGGTLPHPHRTIENALELPLQRELLHLLPGSGSRRSVIVPGDRFPGFTASLMGRQCGDGFTPPPFRLPRTVRSLRPSF